MCQAKLELEGPWTRPEEDYGVKKKGQATDDDDDDQQQQGSGKGGSRGDVSSSSAAGQQAARKRRVRPGTVPPTIQEYEHFREVISSTDLPLCRPTRVDSPADFAVVPPPERAEDSERPYAVEASAIGKLKVGR